MRIAVGLIIIIDLLIRASDLEAFYTEDGIVPLKVLALNYRSGLWSIHALSGALLFEKIIFAIHLTVAIIFTVGYRARLMAVLLWLLTISMHNRNPFINQAGDDLLRMVILCCTFIPCNGSYSAFPEKDTDSSALRYFTYLFTIASVYLFTVLLKQSDEWRSEGTAVYYALSLGQLRLPAGDLIYHYPSLMRVLTFTVLIFETAVPLLILWPSKRNTLRTLAFILIVILHSSIGLTLYVGLFYLISIVCAIGLLGRKHPVTDGASKTERTFSAIALDFAAIALIVLTIEQNLSTLPQWPFRAGTITRTAVSALRFDTNWAMFSPSVLKRDGWYVYEGVTQDERTIDIRTGSYELDFSEPRRIVSMYKSDRWRKLSENMQLAWFTFLRPAFCRYHLRKWNSIKGNPKVKMLNMYFMEKTIYADYHTTKPVKTLYSSCDAR
jgi:hypothetical protein